jgi:hypothetical protein
MAEEMACGVGEQNKARRNSDRTLTGQVEPS